MRSVFSSERPFASCVTPKKNRTKPASAAKRRQLSTREQPMPRSWDLTGSRELELGLALACVQPHFQALRVQLDIACEELALPVFRYGRVQTTLLR
jgi:hypothetical protein